MTDSSSEDAAPTVVLVHGAFADAGSWAAVTERLVRAGVPVRAIVNPLRGVSSDAAYVASAISQISGPVLAVGHSYGGAVITNAVPHTTNVVGLVYVAAFAPDEGELLGDIVASSKDSVLLAAVLPTEYPAGDDETAPEAIVDPAKFHEVFTADLPKLAVRRAGRLSAPDRCRRVQREERAPGVEGPAGVGGGRNRGQGRRDRCRDVDGPACRSHDHRDPRLPRDHDLPARRGDRGHPDRTQRRQRIGRGDSYVTLGAC